MTRVLHVLDHSIPLHSGYTFRTAALLREQRALGWQTFHVTSPKQGQTVTPVEDVDGLRFYRTQPAAGHFVDLPIRRELALMRQLESRLDEVAHEIRPDIIHAHSPVLNAMPAIKVARRLRIPVVYEIRAFWEDAAVDHGSTSEGHRSLRRRSLRGSAICAARLSGAQCTRRYVARQWLIRENWSCQRGTATHRIGDPTCPGASGDPTTAGRLCGG